MEGSWAHFSHDADMGVRGIGNTLEEAFEQGACALSAVITNLDRIDTFESIDIRIEPVICVKG